MREGDWNYFKLSDKQTEALRLYAAGMKLATVARHLQISPNTLSYHLRIVRQKSERIGSRVTTQRDMLRVAQELGTDAEGARAGNSPAGAQGEADVTD